MRSLKFYLILLGIFAIGFLIANPIIDFESPTVSDGYSQTTDSVEINFSITEANLDTMAYNWNGTNFTYMNNSLVLFMNFDNVTSLGENDTYVGDWSGNEYNGSAYGGYDGDSGHTTLGKHGGAWMFDEAGDYIATSFNENMTTWTISSWINIKRISSDYILDARESSTKRILYYTTGGNFALGVYDGALRQTIMGVSTDTWYHATLSYNGTDALAYLDGQLEGYSSVNIPTFKPTSFYIGSNTVTNSYFNGTIDEVRIWSKSLSADEIYQEYVASFNKFNSTGWNLYINQSLNSTDGLTDGDYTYFGYAKNSSSNDAMTGIRIVTIDTVAPQVTIDAPTNNTYTDSNMTFNITLSEAGTCLYSFNDGLLNQTMTNSSSTNWGGSNTTMQQGAVNVTALCNDTVNYNLTEVIYFSVDSVVPTVDFESPTLSNDSSFVDTLEINISASDSGGGLDTITINIWNASGTVQTNTSVSSPLYVSLTGLGIEEYYVNASANDSINNIAWTATRTLKGNSKPGFFSISASPSAANSVDPGIEVVVSVNVSEANSNFDTAVLSYKNSTSSTWTNVSLSNTTEKSSYTFLNASFTLFSYEDNITYRVWANDSLGASNISSNSTLVSYWDCDWSSISDLGSTAGWDENIWIGNISVNNTGDVEHSSSNCSLDFRLTYDLVEGRIYYDDEYVKNLDSYTLAAGTNQTIVINATFGLETKSEDVVITLDEFRARTGTRYRNTTATIVTNQQGPYLSQTISSSPSSINLTAGNFSLESYLRNLMGSVTVNENNTAYNVSFNWTLPSGLTNVSGSLNLNFTNITDKDFHYNNINVSFSDLASMTSGVHTVYLYAQGYNLTGDLIENADGDTLFIESASINFLCYDISDDVIVTSCGSLDGDYVAPTTTTTTTSSGGGGGGGGIVKRVKTSADFQLVRGKENKVKVSVKNRYANGSLTNLKFSVTGDIAKYIDVTPKEVDVLNPNQIILVTLTIISPTYIELGRQEIVLLIEGKRGGTAYFESKKITLEIHELDQEQVSNLLNKSQDMIKSLNKANLSFDYLEVLLNESFNSMNVFDYEKIQKNYEIIKEQVESALDAKKIIDDLSSLVGVAEKKGIDISNSLRLLKLATLSLERREFMQAYERAKEAQITYALEVKGEIGNIGYYALVYPKEISLAALFLALFSFGTYRVGKLQLLKRKIKKLGEEEVILEQLVALVQKECFEEKKMSMDEYEAAILQYQERMHNVIQKTIELENKRAHALKFTSKDTRAKLERAKLIEMIKQLQTDYIKKGKVETKAYQLKLESYDKRLTEIDEGLAFLEAEKAIKKQKGFFGFGKKKEGTLK